MGDEYSRIVPTQEASVEKFPESTKLRELPRSLPLTFVIDMVRYLSCPLSVTFVIRHVRYLLRYYAKSSLPDTFVIYWI